IIGMAESNARVSSYMRNIDASDWMSDSKLSVIQADGGSDARVRNFSLSATHGSPKKDDQEGAE
ncbi:MAG TPA: pilus assembly protein PilN, partial [Chromatiaceae bacterium]|nr:pilus assembly protein PilN [Chromatiaceae bacterium]